MKEQTTDIVLVACHTGSLLQNTPLGVGSLRAALPSSCRSRILNLPPDFDLDNICKAISALNPKIVGFSVYVWNRVRLEKLAYKLRLILPDAVFVAGGPEVCNNLSVWEQPLKHTPLYDVVITGHAEMLFRQLVSDVLDGTFKRTTSTRRWCETSTLGSESPWLTGTLPLQRGVLLETARGCPFRCAYCFDARGSRGVTPVSTIRLQQELELFAARGVEQVWILDSSFNVPCSRGKDLLQLFLNYAPGLHYHLEAKAEYIDTETAELLAQLSCSVQVGLQSVHTQVLKHVDRTLDMTRFEAGLFELHQHGVTYGIDLIYGLPEDTYAGLRESLDTALAFYPNHIELFPLALLPGTRLEERRDIFALNALPYPPYTVISTSSMGAEDFNRAAVLTAALNLFYNTGRAVAYFDALCSACNCSGVELLEHLGSWLVDEGHMPGEAPMPDWGIKQAYTLQVEFIAVFFSRQGLGNILSAALDVMHYNFLYAETILASPLTPGCIPDNSAAEDNPGTWALAQGVRMGEFAYSVEIYHTTVMDDLVEFVCLNSPQRCGAMFYRTPSGGIECREVPVEVIGLLQSCDGAEQLPEQFGSMDSVRTAVWLQHAIENGVLLQRSF